ncbi:MAG: DUF5103 domain-containing protein, partial [Paludibacteraceae bacterium]|nr:DUF5103 domain-containing protein [Paludibacteraceae bacterium]
MNILIALALLVQGLSAQQYETKAYKNTVKTMRTSLKGDRQQDFPVIALDGGTVTFSFDELNGEIQNYNYTLVHCDADWTASSLNSMEWADGFVTNEITDADISANTTQQYVHYSLTVPNADVSLKASGNYALIVHEAENPENVVCVFCFYVSEQAVAVLGNVTAETRKEIKKRYQELQFDVLQGRYPMRDASTEMKVMVMQNSRPDTRVWLQPTFISAGKFSYKNNDALVFEGGAEYHSIDFSSRFSYGEGIEKIRFYDPYYHVELMPDDPKPTAPYEFMNDVNGRYVINVQEWDDDDFTSDYYFVHFFVPMPSPLFGGKLYVLGDFNHNRLDENSRMIY